MHVLRGRQEIAKALGTSTWKVSELFSSVPGMQHTQPDPKLLSKLLKQAGLQAVPEGSEKEAMLLKELSKQLHFVEHISAVDTENVEPLVRIGGGSDRFFDTHKLLQAEKKRPDPSSNNWSPTQLAQQKSGDFYVLREGLRRE
jgi:Asp-tRNA(Asn)/Glu-tRNA(Gln) amidotransferase C subunit